MGKAGAHAYVRFPQERSEAVFKRDVIVSEGFTEAEIKGPSRKTVNNVYSSRKHAKEGLSRVLDQSRLLLVSRGSAPEVGL